MLDYIRNERSTALGIIAAIVLMLGGVTLASAHGMGAKKPPEETRRGRPVYHGGSFFIFYTGGGYGHGPRGVHARGFAGGGPGRGK